MTGKKEIDLMYVEKNDVVHFALKMAVRRRTLWVLLVLLGAVLIALGSSLSEETRRMILDVLFGALQFVLLQGQSSKQ